MNPTAINETLYLAVGYTGKKCSTGSVFFGSTLYGTYRQKWKAMREVMFVSMDDPQDCEDVTPSGFLDLLSKDSDDDSDYDSEDDPDAISDDDPDAISDDDSDDDEDMDRTEFTLTSVKSHLKQNGDKPTEWMWTYIYNSDVWRGYDDDTLDYYQLETVDCKDSSQTSYNLVVYCQSGEGCLDGSLHPYLFSPKEEFALLHAVCFQCLVALHQLAVDVMDDDDRRRLDCGLEKYVKGTDVTKTNLRSSNCEFLSTIDKECWHPGLYELKVIMDGNESYAEKMKACTLMLKGFEYRLSPHGADITTTSCTVQVHEVTVVGNESGAVA